jgi:hypothetical protein
MVEIVGRQLVPVEVGVEEPPAIRHKPAAQVLALKEVYTELLEIGVVGFAVDDVYSILKRHVKPG